MVSSIIKSQRSPRGKPEQQLLLSDRFTDTDNTNIVDHPPGVNAIGNPWRRKDDSPSTGLEILNNRLERTASSGATACMDFNMIPRRVDFSMRLFTLATHTFKIRLGTTINLSSGAEFSFLQISADLLLMLPGGSFLTLGNIDANTFYDMSLRYDPVANKTRGISHAFEFDEEQDASGVTFTGTFFGLDFFTVVAGGLAIDDLKVFV